MTIDNVNSPENTVGNQEENTAINNIRSNVSGHIENTVYKNLSNSSILIKQMGEPYFFDYTDPIFSELPIRDIAFMQNWNEKTLRENNKQWGIAGYLEDRSLRLRGTHLLEEGRVYHLGIDIIAPTGTNIFSPLAGEVIESAVELGSAGYGGYVIIRYALEDSMFYVLYGHLNPDSLHNIGSINPGEVVGEIGSPDVNGGWTTHLHMQAFTGVDFEEWKMKGYCSLKDMKKIRTICLDPSFLLRY
ncbi:MAG: peptidoglycan DD-metalloendopeptidase family protein [Candidatus Gracilibacteria bacterium]|nr:peptidoglycan DD-metalloendopeptidase family protein [Candidatus Gracilibacteria bacterium]